MLLGHPSTAIESPTLSISFHGAVTPGASVSPSHCLPHLAVPPGMATAVGQAFFPCSSKFPFVPSGLEPRFLDLTSSPFLIYAPLSGEDILQ